MEIIEIWEQKYDINKKGDKKNILNSFKTSRLSRHRYKMLKLDDVFDESYPKCTKGECLDMHWSYIAVFINNKR